MKKKLIFFALLSLILFPSCVEINKDVTDLRCEYAVEPQGIDILNPRLSWKITSNEREVKQLSYRILVASTLENLNAETGDLWDSGVVESDESQNIVYAGQALKSRTNCYWKVKITTTKGEKEWSKTASWTMGLLENADWEAQWTGLDKATPDDALKGRSRLAARYLRKEFEPENKKIKSATLHISGLGLYEAYINGSRIGKQVLSPTPTDYDKSVKYNTFDVTKLIAKGKNAIGVTLGNGRYFGMRFDANNELAGRQYFGFPKLLAQLEIAYSDGSQQTIVSDDTWKITADGPIRANNEYDGEEYDATKELIGWNKVGYDDGFWQTAELVAAPAGKLEGQLNPNIQIMETIKPLSIKQLNEETYILDMGQNMVGWLAMTLRGEKGKQVKLRFSEVLKEDGSLYLANIRDAQVTDKYTLKGEKSESWEPSFTYHGFRFVEITGYPGVPTVKNFSGKVIYDEMETTGHFETSDTTINQIYKNAYWGIRGNYRGMPTDCPQRDERMGWLGDRAVGSQGESFVFDNHLLYAKWLDDIEESQREDGSIPDVAPNYWVIYSDNMTWPGAYVIIANMLYEQFGDKEPIVKHYDSMKKWMAYIQSKYLTDNIMTKDTYGDWCMPPERPELIHSEDPARKTDAAVLGTTFYFRMLTLLEKYAGMLGKTEDIQQFAEEAEAVKASFNAKYLNTETMQYSNNTVTANLLALCYGMVPEEYQKGVFENIVNKTLVDFNGHISTGLVGAQWLMRGLSDNGRPDIALKIATNRDYPSWGFMIEHDATTIWELWNGNTADPAMNSHNHVMLLGDLLVWFYEYLGGIKAAEPGFKKIEMKPCAPEGLNFVNASLKSVYGTIESAWKKEEGKFSWTINVPANTSAVIYVPATDENKVSESGKPASTAEGVKFVELRDGYAVYEIASGKYNFSASN
ncbi:MAG: glycoside hydrolase family 78 protein [Dysgonamonadaceae bacterium]|jgi:alpha-L-rhamnosidase|nr:glycoside hydrolase family 78 protein [Dysgonamonadaceae bacterium]